jgi:CheY-like chemotaxis protein
MPDLDGASLAAAIKADPQIADTIVVMLTSMGTWREVRGMEGTAIDACLVKPVRQSQLYQALSGAWNQRLACQEKRAEEGAPVRVLVADDNVVNQRVAVRMLESLGARADVAANGLEALEMLRLLRYDLVLMDSEMPVMDGIDATGEIRRREGGHRHTTIVAMMGDVPADGHERLLESGTDDVLMKPVSIQALDGMLEKWAREPA